MTEHEKQLQIGRLGEELSVLKGHLNHVTEKLRRAESSYTFAGQIFKNLRFVDGKLAWPRNAQQRDSPDLAHLLSYQELSDAVQERDKLIQEIQEKSANLKVLAPHLL